MTFIHLSDGFKVLAVDIKNRQYEVRLNITGDAFAWFYHYCSSFGDITQHRDKAIINIIEEEKIGEFKNTLKYLEPFLTQISLQKIDIEEEWVDKRKKVPHTKLFLRFSAG